MTCVYLAGTAFLSLKRASPSEAVGHAVAVKVQLHGLGREALWEQLCQAGDFDGIVRPHQVDGQRGVELAHELAAGSAGAHVRLAKVGGDGDAAKVAIALCGRKTLKTTPNESLLYESLKTQT